jgi:hypothetical protein
MDLEADLRAEILKYLPTPDADAARWLHSMATERLLDCFLTLRDRVPHPHPRTLHIAPELIQNPQFSAWSREIGLVWDKVVQGVDLTPHLSRRVRFSYLQDVRRPRNVDLLLSEWNVHYLHISSVIGPDGYVARGNPLLFAMFTNGAAYFLDIAPAAGWSLQRLVEIAVTNWPDEALFHKLIGGIPERSSTAKDRARRRKGMDTYVLVNKVAYVANHFGQDADVTSPRNTVLRLKLLGLLKYFADNPTALGRECNAANAGFGIEWPLIPQFRLIIAQTARGFEFVILEERTKLMMALDV